MFSQKSLSPGKLLNSICFLFLFGIIYQCENEPLIPNVKEPIVPPVEEPVEIKPLTHSDSVAIARMPKYYEFLDTMKKSGYVFYDFRTYIKTDTSLLPKKLLVIRHDVHYRDINYAYIVFKIEQIVIGAGHSTFFIMLNDPKELVEGDGRIQNLYMNLIHHLDSHNVDIQPHVSPIDLYVDNIHPYWEHYTRDTLKALFAQNYYFDIKKEGRQIVVTGEDVFDLNDINNQLVTLLPEYNEEWTRQTNIEVQGYAAHGSSTTMNYILNNAYLLDQFSLLSTGIYQYDTYNSKIFSVLTYLSDNNLPSWMKNPGSIRPGRYQFLMHPYQWSNLKSAGTISEFD